MLLGGSGSCGRADREGCRARSCTYMGATAGAPNTSSTIASPVPSSLRPASEALPRVNRWNNGAGEP